MNPKEYKLRGKCNYVVRFGPRGYMCSRGTGKPLDHCFGCNEVLKQLNIK